MSFHGLLPRADVALARVAPKLATDDLEQVVGVLEDAIAHGLGGHVVPAPAILLLRDSSAVLVRLLGAVLQRLLRLVLGDVRLALRGDVCHSRQVLLQEGRERRLLNRMGRGLGFFLRCLVALALALVLALRAQAQAVVVDALMHSANLGSAAKATRLPRRRRALRCRRRRRGHALRDDNGRPGAHAGL
eukprot:scaffold82045_cov14-Tisochrysis_lutea.AAC.1